MHYHCEMIIPPTDDVDAAVASVMAPFREGMEDNPNPFWDFYVIGGRFAGNKQMAKYDEGKLHEFHQWLLSKKVTVSSVQCGKQELMPASQIPVVDAKWNEMFPSDTGKSVACPIFAHSNDQYGRDGNGTLAGDICKLAEAKDVSCERIIIAGPTRNKDTDIYDGPLEATYMISQNVWNGVTLLDIDWDGKVASAIAKFAKRLESYKNEYSEIVRPQDDWLAVTVDYHS